MRLRWPGEHLTTKPQLLWYHLSKVGVGAISPNICESVNAVMDEFSVVMARPRAVRGDPQPSMKVGIRGHPRRRSGLSRFGELTRSLGLRCGDLAEMDLTVVINGSDAYP